MSWKQDKQPNLDPVVYNAGKALTDWYGWCLATVRAAFNAPYAGPNAEYAWQNTTKYKHTDRNFPVGVYFPIWFTGYGGLGHVAFAFVNSSGEMNIWTSPYTHTPYFYTGYHDVDKLASGYGITFAGWSEDIAGMRVIEQVSDSVPTVQPPYTVENITPKLVASNQARSEWDLNDTTWAAFGKNPVTVLAPNTPIEVKAIAHHVLGGQYYMPDPSKAAGYNVVDLPDYTAPAAPEQQTPAPTPPNPTDSGALIQDVVATPPAPVVESLNNYTVMPAKTATSAKAATPSVTATVISPVVLTTADKAIAAGTVTTIVAWLAHYGVTLTPLMHDALASLSLSVATFVIAHLTVYLVPNRKK